MENASKALIMAGGLLISLMVASLLVYVFSNFGEHAREVTAGINERHQTAANEEFLQYEGSLDNTIYDIVTAANNARDNNESLGVSEGDRGYIAVRIQGGISGAAGTGLEKPSTDLNELLNEYTKYELNPSNPKRGERVLFSCVVDSADGMISEVTFKRIP